MNREQIDKKHRLLEQLIMKKRLKEAFDLLKQFIHFLNNSDYKIKLEGLLDTYHFILKYSMQGVNDPQREDIYNSLRRNMLELADTIRESALLQSTDMQTYKLKRHWLSENKLSLETAIDKLNNLTLGHELNSVLQTGDDSQAEQRTTLIEIFHILWLADHYQESDIKLFMQLCHSKVLPWYEKSVLLSALTLSSLRSFDINKILILLKCSKEAETQVKERALTGLALSLYFYGERLEIYPETEIIFNELQSPDLQDQLEIIILHLLKTKETEKITRRFHEEIVPEVMKMRPKIQDKLDLDNMLSDEFSDDKNPDWETFFKDVPGIYEKLEEMSKLQMEGADVFMGTFAMLKHFEFFKKTHNWFLPYYPEHHEVNDILSLEKGEDKNQLFLETISHSAFLCNSDKYSFCLNLKRLPDLQKKQMFDMLNNELKSMNDISKENAVLDQKSTSKWIIIQYIHDLYRFFKLYPLRHEYPDIFSMPMRFHRQIFFTRAIQNKDFIRNIAEFYFEKEYYTEALEVYKIIEEQGEVSYELFEKIAYANQRLEKYDKALIYYKKAELFGTNSAWILKKIAFNYRKGRDFEKSLSYYKQAEKLEPENLFIAASIGNCYLDMEEYDKALQHYFKVELESPDNQKILRPIAWCYFILGKLEEARNYNQKILDANPNQYDYMNAGHVEWCLGNSERAVDFYRKSIKTKGNSLKAFMLGFDDDLKFLIKNGIKPQDVPLTLDFLKFQLNK